MSNRNPLVALVHMLHAAQEANELVQTTTCSDLDHQRLLQLSVVRLLEIVGEAAQRVSDETRARSPILWEIPRIDPI